MKLKQAIELLEDADCIVLQYNIGKELAKTSVDLLGTYILKVSDGKEFLNAFYINENDLEEVNNYYQLINLLDSHLLKTRKLEGTSDTRMLANGKIIFDITNGEITTGKRPWQIN